MVDPHAIGVGVDLTDVAEFERLPFEHNVAFYRRMFSSDEIAYCLGQADPASHFAARFAAKEATVKAFNSVVPLAYWQVEVTRDDSGAPTLRIWDEARTQAEVRVSGYQSLVSLSHTPTAAAAFVVVYDERRMS